jgi:diketogulonate reductase-like aldo/keto reductase
MSSCSGTNSSLVGDMPLIGWGTYMIDKADNVVAAALRQALALGYRRIDCAPVYFNEDAIGNALHAILHPTTTTASTTTTGPPSPPSHESGAVTANDDNDDDAPGPNPLVQLQRSDLYIVSKLPSPFHRHVEAAVRKTLHDLRLDYLDLYLGAYRHMYSSRDDTSLRL